MKRTIIDLPEPVEGETPEAHQTRIEAHIGHFRDRHFGEGGDDEGIWIRSGRWKGRPVQDGWRLCDVTVRRP